MTMVEITYAVANSQDIMAFLRIGDLRASRKVESGRQENSDHGDGQQRRVELCRACRDEMRRQASVPMKRGTH